MPAKRPDPQGHRIILLGLLGIGAMGLIGCKKEEVKPTVYHFRIVDQYTRQPLNNATIIRSVVGQGLETDTMGSTGPNGIFTFTFSGEPYAGARTRFIFEHADYFFEWFFELRTGQDPQFVDIGLYGRSTLALAIRRISPEGGCPPESLELWYGVSGVSPCVSCVHEAEGPDPDAVTYRYFEVPAMYPKFISHRTHHYSSCTALTYGPYINEEIMIGHFDTTTYVIDY